MALHHSFFSQIPHTNMLGQFQTAAVTSQKNKASSAKILSIADAPPFDVRNASSKTPCLVICDHASNTVPQSLGSLGVSQENLNRHIGVDIGSRDVGVYMSHELDATVVMANYSRLVVDLNRGIGTRAQMPIESDYTLIPGNLNLGVRNEEARINELYLPYHAEVSKHTHRLIENNAVPSVLIFVHSCTDEMNGKKRPWEIGVLFDKDEKLAMRFIDALRKNNPDFNIGENQPYTMKKPLPGNSIERHAVRLGLPHLVLEFRQDLVNTREKAQAMAELALESLRPILADHAFLKENYTPKKPLYHQAVMAFEYSRLYQPLAQQPLEPLPEIPMARVMPQAPTSSFKLKPTSVAVATL